MTGTEDGHVVFYSISSEKAAMISCGDASEIVLGLDALPHGDVAVGMMGSENQVLIFSPFSVCLYIPSFCHTTFVCFTWPSHPAFMNQQTHKTHGFSCFRSSSICAISSADPKSSSRMIRAVISAARFFRSLSGSSRAFSFVYASPPATSPTVRQSDSSFEKRSMSSSSFVFATTQPERPLLRIAGSAPARWLSASCRRFSSAVFSLLSLPTPATLFYSSPSLPIATQNALWFFQSFTWQSFEQ